MWRASRPSGQALQDYRDLLAKALIRPGKLEIFIMNLEERKPIQLTDNGAASFGPYWHPDGKHIIFSSNLSERLSSGSQPGPEATPTSYRRCPGEPTQFAVAISWSGVSARRDALAYMNYGDSIPIYNLSLPLSPRCVATGFTNHNRGHRNDYIHCPRNWSPP